MNRQPNVLIGMTGSISLLAMPAYLAELRTHFEHLKIIMTYTATKLLPAESLSMFTEGIYTSEFPLSQTTMGHVALARWADLFIVIPATAHLLYEAAHGSASSLLTATILAYEKRVIFFPNMNSAMWKKKSVQRNVTLLEEDLHRVIIPLQRPVFEYASKEIKTNHVLPSVESVLSILKLEMELLS